MKKEIFINETMGQTRIAIQEESKLVEVYVEQQDNQRMVGNVYKGKVENVLPGMQAAFIDIGSQINAFLPFTEISTYNVLEKDFVIEIDDRKTQLLNLNLPRILKKSNSTSKIGTLNGSIFSKVQSLTISARELCIAASSSDS